MRFLRLLRLLCEATVYPNFTPFGKLPDSAPYGFWVSPKGEMIIVQWQQHYNRARDYVDFKRTEADPVWLQRQELALDDADHYQVMYNDGFARVVLEKSIDVLYWELGSSEKSPTTHQMRTLRDIGKLYQLERLSRSD